MNEEQIVNYLLGGLPEAERTALEERFLRDVEYRELIRAAEDDLIDDYVHGELAPHQRELFEKHFISLPHRRQKVELARALSRTLRERRRGRRVHPITAAGERVSAWWSSLLSPPGAPNWAVRFALTATALALLAGGVWLVSETSRSRATPERSAAELRVPQQKEEKPSPPPTPPSTSAGERGGLEEPARQSRESAPPPQLSIATFVLPPGLARDSAQGLIFVIPEGTRFVRLRLPLEAGDAYPAYRVELRTASGTPVWRNDLVRPVRRAGAQSVVLDLSPDILPSDKYELTLAGIDKDVVEDVGYYYFSFVKK